MELGDNNAKMCKVKGPDEYTGRCHRDVGHEGSHRAFKVGWYEPFEWPATPNIECEPKFEQRLDDYWENPR